MTEKDIYSGLRLDTVQRKAFIDSLSDEDLKKAYTLNNAMFEATMSGKLDDLDKKFGYVPSSDNKESSKLVERMNDMDNDMFKPTEAEIEAAQKEIEAEYEEDLNSQNVSISAPKEEASVVDEESNLDGGVMFTVTDAKPSDEALEKLKNDAAMINASVQLKEMPKMNIEVNE